MKTKMILLLQVVVVILFACNNQGKKVTEAGVGDSGMVKDAVITPKADNSMNSLDWDGIYKGVLPCADCEGIETTITINRDLSYNISGKYLGKNNNAPFVRSGKFSWNADGNIITLDNGNSNTINQYMVGENKLIQLDINGQRITGGLADKYELLKQ